MIVITAVTSHAAIISAGESTSREISAETIKMPEPIIDPITIAVELNKPSPRTNWCSDAARDLFSRGSVGNPDGVDTCMWFYRNFAKKSLAIFPGVSPWPSRSGLGPKIAEITATESAPASSTALQFSSVIPPIATSGFFVIARARRTPSIPITGDGFSFVAVANTGPIAT